MKYLLPGAETQRLHFRLTEENDFDTWLGFFKNKKTSRYLALSEKKDPKTQCREWFDKLNYRLENDLGGLNVLESKSSHDLVGFAGLLVQEVDGIEELEIGYSIMPHFWGKGYATEAAIKCKELAFQNKFSDSLISIIHIDNKPSERVAVKNGMVKEKQTIFKGMPVNIFRIIAS